MHDTVSAAADHVRSTIVSLRDLAAEHRTPGIVLTSPAAVAWATAGMNVPIDRSAGIDTVWVVVGPDRCVLLTTGVEAPRLAAEHDLGALGLELIAGPWWDESELVTTAAAVSRAPADQLGSDGHAGFGVDLSTVLALARLTLDPWERQQLVALGRDASAAVQGALRHWRPGQSDREVAARIAAAVELRGAQAPVLLVGGDDRLRRFRHPVAVGVPLVTTVMAVLVASRGGQHVALTRYASAHEVDAELAAGLVTTRRIHRRVLAACLPGATAGAVLDELATAYADEGFPDAWQQHYQGGPIGYRQREFEIAPHQTTSPWWTTRLAAGTAVAWNPSLPGGPKDEDTYLIDQAGLPDQAGLTPVTVTPDWPMADAELPARPGVLVVGE